MGRVNLRQHIAMSRKLCRHVHDLIDHIFHVQNRLISDGVDLMWIAAISCDAAVVSRESRSLEIIHLIFVFFNAFFGFCVLYECVALVQPLRATALRRLSEAHRSGQCEFAVGLQQLRIGHKCRLSRGPRTGWAPLGCSNLMLICAAIDEGALRRTRDRRCFLVIAPAQPVGVSVGWCSCGELNCSGRPEASLAADMGIFVSATHIEDMTVSVWHPAVLH